MKNLKVGVLGAGHLGKIHLKLLKETEGYDLVGFYDPDNGQADIAKEQFEIPAFESIEELIDAVDVVDVVTPTLSHFECASLALRRSKHVFIEKPVTNTLEEAESLMKLAEEAKVKVQIGHVERFNPAFISGRPYIDHPMFIESHRLAQFNPRGTDVPVVMDLMIHDIDIILSIVNSNIKRISASGVSVVSDTPDIANARIEFGNGCVANITASRISLKNMRKTRIFQRDAYIAIDFLKKKAEVVRIDDAEVATSTNDMYIELADKTKRRINFEFPQVEENNAIQEELRAFRECIENDARPAVTIQDGYNALQVAHQIVSKLNLDANLLTSSI
ncbi:MAG: gfo/Idh/MocA family oxidoreductase [Flavobacteriales bacterium]|nr:gfo/Idh/MocA family oxidoreductase [Flavobacteriales bacterium]